MKKATVIGYLPISIYGIIVLSFAFQVYSHFQSKKQKQAEIDQMKATAIDFSIDEPSTLFDLPIGQSYYTHTLLTFAVCDNKLFILPRPTNEDQELLASNFMSSDDIVMITRTPVGFEVTYNAKFDAKDVLSPMNRELFDTKTMLPVTKLIAKANE